MNINEEDNVEKSLNKEMDTESLDSNNLKEKNDDLVDLNDSNIDEKVDIEEQSKPLEFKVILLGDTNVGKTSILYKFIDGTFLNKVSSTINVEFKTQKLKIDKNLYAVLSIYDTAGQERYRSITRQYYHDANGIILVFDLTNENSFTKLNSWIKDINENAGNVEVILVGNKSDLEDRKITKYKAEIFAKEKNVKYIETSAKEGTNILLLFEEFSIGMNKRRKEESSSNVELGSIQTYVCRREEINRELKNRKESKCC